MATSIRNKYHIAINTIGYILRGAPNAPAYTRSVIPSQVNRLAISDINYSDFAGTGLFYTAQTDWSAGMKDEKTWKDDAKFYFSTNLDTASNPNSIKAMKSLTADNDFTDDINCGSYETVAGTPYPYIGTKHSTKAILYRYASSSWTDISGSWMPNNATRINDAMSHGGKLWVLADGTATTYAVTSCDDDGSSETDHTADINTAMGWTNLTGATAIAAGGGVLYIAVHKYNGALCGIVQTDDVGTTWTLVVSFSEETTIVDMKIFGGYLYYLIEKTGLYQLRKYDIVNSIDIFVQDFPASFSSVGNRAPASRRLLHILSGKLVLVIPAKELWEIDSSGNLTRILVRDDYKYTTLAATKGESSFALQILGESQLKGGVYHDYKLWFGNLIYDGESFFNSKKGPNDTANKFLIPLFSNGTSIYWVGEEDLSYLYKDASTYKATTAKNYIILNEMSPVVSIDKLLYSITAMFEKMVSGDEIKIEYSIDSMATWTTAATLTYATEGGSSVKREIIIPGSIIFSKIWWRVSMANTGGATSPTLLDLIMAYRPMPDYKNQWQVRLNMSDGVKLLNRQNDERDGMDLSSQIWNEKLVKRKVKFQDIDYIECSLKTSMTKTQTSAMITSVKKLPAQGRIRAVSGSVAEEMYYTSAKADRIMGITRGARGTTARAYLSGQVLDNGYDVYVEDITTSLNFTDEEKTESVAQVLLIEA